MEAVRKLRSKVARAARVLLNQEWAFRNLTVYPDDVFLVSYPRSGNTWLRFLVGNLVRAEAPVTFANIESVVPSIYVNTDLALRKIPRPRILKSHEAFFAKYRKVIYIVRDPRDVAVSYYHYLIKYRQLPDGYPLADFVRRFMIDDFKDYFAPWGDHVQSWLAMRETRDAFLLLRCEDLMDDAARELAKVASFLNTPATAENLARAVELSSAKRMKSLEQKESRVWVSTKNSRQDMPFIRSAKSGGWKSSLPEEAALTIESAWGNVMQSLGYELATQAGRLPKVAARL